MVAVASISQLPAVFAGDGAVPREHLSEQFVQRNLGTRFCAGFLEGHHYVCMNVAVAGMTETGELESVLFLQSRRNRVGYGFAGGGRRQRHFAAGFTKRRDRIANRFADGEGQHEWRFPHRLAAVNHIRLRCLRQEGHVENFRHTPNRRDFVGVGRMREQFALRIPNQFFAR